MQCAAIGVNVPAGRTDVGEDGSDVKRREDEVHDGRCRSVGTVEQHAEATEVDTLDLRTQPRSVVVAKVLFAGKHRRTFAFALGTFELFEVIEDLGFDLVFNFVGQLESIGAKNFNAVIHPRIVRSRDYDAGGEAMGSCEVGHARSSYDAGASDFSACAQQAASQGTADPFAGLTSVLPDENARGRMSFGETRPEGTTDRKHSVRVERVFSGNTADPVGAKKLSYLAGGVFRGQRGHFSPGLVFTVETVT